MEWLENISNAIEYIEKNLDKEISYDEAARIACCRLIIFSECFPLLPEFRYRNIYEDAR